MTRKDRRIKMAKTLKLLDEATMTYRTVHLFDVVFSMKHGADVTVRVYAPSENEIMEIANRLYADKGAFGSAISFVRA